MTEIGGQNPSLHTPNCRQSSYLLGSHGSVNLLVFRTIHHHVPVKSGFMTLLLPRKPCRV